MKLIIDIPENLYQEIMYNADEIQENGCVFDRVIINGTPLDDIRQEINNKKNNLRRSPGKSDYITGHIHAFEEAVKIIDRHAGKER